MHSKKSDPSDIEAFMKAWNNQVSLACILFMGESARVLSAVAQRSQFNPFAFIPQTFLINHSFDEMCMILK